MISITTRFLDDKFICQTQKQNTNNKFIEISESTFENLDSNKKNMYSLGDKKVEFIEDIGVVIYSNFLNDNNDTKYANLEAFEADKAVFVNCNFTELPLMDKSVKQLFFIDCFIQKISLPDDSLVTNIFICKGSKIKRITCSKNYSLKTMRGIDLDYIKDIQFIYENSLNTVNPITYVSNTQKDIEAALNFAKNNFSLEKYEKIIKDLNDMNYEINFISNKYKAICYLSDIDDIKDNIKVSVRPHNKENEIELDGRCPVCSNITVNLHPGCCHPLCSYCFDRWKNSGRSVINCPTCRS